MAISSNIYRTRDLNEPTTIEHLPHVLAMGDDQGDQFSIAVTRGSIPVTLDTGACTGWFIRLEENKKIEECETVILTGSVSSNVASVVLPESCYITNGRFIITIFATLEGRRHAVYIGEGMVARTYTDTLVDPGKNIPDISELLAKLGEMETARANAQSAANAANAAAQNANKSIESVDTAVANANTAASKANTEVSKLANATFSATKLAPDANPTVTRTEVSGHYNYNYGIPQGATGAVGPAGPQGTAGATGPQGPQGLKGDTGAAAGFGKITASVDESVGTPSVEVTASGDDTAKNLDFKFHNLKGIPGEGSVSTVYGVQPDDSGDVKPEVGGRNLLLDSKRTIANNKYLIATYIISETNKLAQGEKFTFTIKGHFGNDRTEIYLYNSGSSVSITGIAFSNVRDGVFTISGDWVVHKGTNTAANTHLSIFVSPESSSSENTIEWVKLERGVVPTDWTPAPEDLDAATGDAYTPSNPPPYPVSSVNGQTGATKVVGSVWGATPDDGYDSKPEIGGVNYQINQDIYSLYGPVFNKEKNVTVKEWGATDAIRAYGTIGTNSVFASIGGGIFPTEGLTYTTSLYVKNNSIESDLSFSTVYGNPRVSVLVKHGETKRVILTTKANTSNFAVMVGIVNGLTAFDFTWWHIQSELGVIPTDWSPAPEDLETEIAKAYSVDNPPPYPVSSVNGKTGAVTGLYDANNQPPYPMMTINPVVDNDLNKTLDRGWYRASLPQGQLLHAPADLTGMQEHNIVMMVSHRTGSLNNGVQHLWVYDGSAYYTRGFDQYDGNDPATAHFYSWTKIGPAPAQSITSVNGKTGAVTLDAAAVSAVPTTRKVNTKPLSSDITLSASDVGARPSTWTPTAAEVGALPSTTPLPKFNLQGSVLYITYP